MAHGQQFSIGYADGSGAVGIFSIDTVTVSYKINEETNDEIIVSFRLMQLQLKIKHLQNAHSANLLVAINSMVYLVWAIQIKQRAVKFHSSSICGIKD